MLKLLHGPLGSSTDDAKLNGLGIGSVLWKVNYQVLAGRKEEHMYFPPQLPPENAGEEFGLQNSLA